MKADIERVRLAIPHLEEMGREMIGAIANPDKDLFWVFEGAARFYQGQAQYSLAEDLSIRCLTTLESQLGADHLHVVTSLNNLANLYGCDPPHSLLPTLEIPPLATPPPPPITTPLPPPPPQRS